MHASVHGFIELLLFMLVTTKISSSAFTITSRTSAMRLRLWSPPTTKLSV